LGKGIQKLCLGFLYLMREWESRRFRRRALLSSRSKGEPEACSPLDSRVSMVCSLYMATCGSSVGAATWGVTHKLGGVLTGGSYLDISNTHTGLTSSAGPFHTRPSSVGLSSNAESKKNAVHPDKPCTYATRLPIYRKMCIIIVRWSQHCLAPGSLAE